MGKNSPSAFYISDLGFKKQRKDKRCTSHGAKTKIQRQDFWKIRRNLLLNLKVFLKSFCLFLKNSEFFSSLSCFPWFFTYQVSQQVLVDFFFEFRIFNQTCWDTRGTLYFFCIFFLFRLRMRMRNVLLNLWLQGLRLRMLQWMQTIILKNDKTYRWIKSMIFLYTMISLLL